MLSPENISKIAYSHSPKFKWIEEADWTHFLGIFVWTSIFCLLMNLQHNKLQCLKFVVLRLSVYVHPSPSFASKLDFQVRVGVRGSLPMWLIGATSSGMQFSLLLWLMASLCWGRTSPCHELSVEERSCSYRTAAFWCNQHTPVTLFCDKHCISIGPRPRLASEDLSLRQDLSNSHLSRMLPNSLLK
jgi:hypothetical protein